MKKLIALLLALVMVLGLVACGAKEEAAATEAAGEAAGEAESAEREHVTLKWYVAGNGPQADLDSVLEEVNKYLTEKLNCSLEIVETDFGNYEQKMQMVISAQEEFDICWTSHWCNNFYTNVSKNAFLELDELVANYAPELVEIMPQGGWDACKVNGSLYGVPSQQIWAMTNAVQINKDVAAQYNFDVSSVKELKDIEPLLAAYKADHPESYPFGCDNTGLLEKQTFVAGYDEVASRNIPAVIGIDDEELKVYNQFESEEVKEIYQLAYDWAQKGYIRMDASTLSSSDVQADWKAGSVIAELMGNYKPTPQASNVNMYGCEMEYAILSNSYLTTSGITATMNAISRTSKNPERAMEFLNLLNTDVYLYNLITQGIAGKHYEDLGEGYIKVIDGSGYTPNADWMYGNQFLAYLKEGQDPTDWIVTQELNNSGIPSVAQGFVFDSVPVQNEMAAVTAVINEYHNALSCGVLDPEEYLPEFVEKLNAAGAENIQAEVQNQLNAWAGK